jgi:hypothetical protein
MTDKDNTRTLREARLREAQRNVPEIETLADARKREKQRKKQQRKEKERATDRRHASGGGDDDDDDGEADDVGGGVEEEGDDDGESRDGVRTVRSQEGPRGRGGDRGDGAGVTRGRRSPNDDDVDDDEVGGGGGGSSRSERVTPPAQADDDFSDSDVDTNDRNPNNGITVSLLSSVLAAEAAAELDEEPAPPSAAESVTSAVPLDLVSTFHDLARRVVGGANPLGASFATGLVLTLEEQKRRKEQPAFTGGDGEPVSQVRVPSHAHFAHVQLHPHQHLLASFPRWAMTTHPIVLKSRCALAWLAQHSLWV